MTAAPAAMPLQAALLDLGNTLADLGPSNGLPHGRADWRGREALLRKVAATGGRAASAEDLARWLFDPWRAQYERRYETGREAPWAPHLRRLRRETGARARDLSLLAAWFSPFAESIVPLAGAAAALAGLKAQGLRLAVVSNVPLPGRLYEAALRRCGLLRDVEVLAWSYDLGCRKPSPALPRFALEALGVAADRAIMVGDRRRSDVAAGRAAGVRATVWVRAPDGPGPHVAPDFTIERIAELPALVASRFP